MFGIRTMSTMRKKKKEKKKKREEKEDAKEMVGVLYFAVFTHSEIHEYITTLPVKVVLAASC